MSFTTEKAGSQNPPAVAAAPAALAPQHEALSSPTTALADAASERGNLLTRDEARRVIAPFINARLHRHRDPVTNYTLPRLQQIDLRVPGRRVVDADVREVTDQGVEYFFYRGHTLIPWHDLDEIIVRSVDDMGEDVASHAFKVAAS